MVVITLMVGSAFISLASFAGLIVHDSMVYEMGQYGMHDVGTGMLFVGMRL